MDPIFWLGLSILLVAVSITAVLMAIIPAVQELGRAARSAEKLFDTLSRELPPTLDAIRQTGVEISSLTDDVSEGVQSASQVAKQVDASFVEVKQQARQVSVTTRSVMAGFKAAWQTLASSEASSEAVAKPRARDPEPPLDHSPDHSPDRLTIRSTAPSTVNPPQTGKDSPSQLSSPNSPSTVSSNSSSSASLTSDADIIPRRATKPTYQSPALESRLSAYAIDPAIDPKPAQVRFDATDRES